MSLVAAILSSRRVTDGFLAPQRHLVQQKRFRGKINIQRPRKLFYERALVTEFVTPYYPRKEPVKPIWEACKRLSEKEKSTNQTSHPYERIIARECLERFEQSKMVAFLHQNSMKAEPKFDLAVALHRADMTLKIYGRGVLKCALEGTRFEAILPLFCAPTILVFGAEPKVKALRKIVKKTPEVVLMAGIFEDKLLDLNDFLKYGEMDLTEARSGLVHTLRTAGGANLNRQLNHHQSTLVSRLEQIGKASSVGNDSNHGESKNEEIKQA